VSSWARRLHASGCLTETDAAADRIRGPAASACRRLRLCKSNCECAALHLAHQPFLVSPRQPQRLAVSEHDDVVAVEVGAQLFDGFDVYDVGAVDAGELFWIEAGLQVGQGAADEVGAAGGVDADVVSFRGEVNYVAGRDEEDSFAVADDNALQIG
jgi:hypothetical protein